MPNTSSKNRGRLDGVGSRRGECVSPIPVSGVASKWSRHCVRTQHMDGIESDCSVATAESTHDGDVTVRGPCFVRRAQLHTTSVLILPSTFPPQSPHIPYRGIIAHSSFVHRIPCHYRNTASLSRALGRKRKQEKAHNSVGCKGKGKKKKKEGPSLPSAHNARQAMYVHPSLLFPASSPQRRGPARRSFRTTRGRSRRSSAWRRRSSRGCTCPPAGCARECRWCGRPRSRPGTRSAHSCR